MFCLSRAEKDPLKAQGVWLAKPFASSIRTIPSALDSNQLSIRLRAYRLILSVNRFTAGGESHPALKQQIKYSAKKNNCQ